MNEIPCFYSYTLGYLVQLCSLTKENKLLREKFHEAKKLASVVQRDNSSGNKEFPSSEFDSSDAVLTKFSAEVATQFLSTSFQAGLPLETPLSFSMVLEILRLKR